MARSPQGKLWSPSEVRAVREEYNKWLAKQPEGQRVKLREVARHIKDTAFPNRTYTAIEAVMQRHRIWKPAFSRGTTSENRTSSIRRPRRRGMVKAYECPGCGLLTKVE
jgi:hypothetical protein